MKRTLNAIRFTVAGLVVFMASQASLYAQSNDSGTTASGLNSGEILGGFAVLLFAVILPLTKNSNKRISHK